MRPPRLRPLTAVLFMATCAATAFCVAADPAPSRLLDEDGVHRLLVTELSTALDGRRRLVPLPRNIGDVVIGPGGEPCFAVSKLSNANPPETLTNAVARVGRHAPGFRILWDATLVGHDGADTLVLTAAPDWKTVVIEGGGTRPADIPAGSAPAQAMRVGGRWMFLTHRGMLAEDEADYWEKSFDLRPSDVRRLLRVGDDGLAAVAPHRDPNGVQSLRYGLRERGMWKAGTPPMTEDQPRTAVRLADGRWLVIGTRIIEARADRPPQPTEQQLQGALAAARAGDWAALMPLLETISTYPPGDAGGLATLLQNLPARGQKLRFIINTLENTRQELTRTQAKEELDKQQADRVGELLAACDRQLQETTKLLKEAVPDLLARSPSEISARLRSGLQFYRGRWISVLDVVRQDRLDSALLLVRLGDDPRGQGTTALARLESDGGLRIVGEIPGMVSQWQGAVSSPDGDAFYVSVPGRGLAKVSAAGLEWLAESGPARGSVQLIGADASGRVYFRQFRTAHQRGEGPVIWMLTPGAPADEPPAVVHLPMIGKPAVDADGSIWFFRTHERRDPRPGQPTATPAPDQPAGIDVKQVEVKVDPDQPLAGGPQPGPKPAIPTPYRTPTVDGTRLCRLTSPRSLSEYVLPEPLAATKLAAGRGAAWLPTSRLDQERQRETTTMFVSGDTLRMGANLHDLAERSFDAMLAVAPEAVLPEPTVGVVPDDAGAPVRQVLRTGDLLWVHDQGRVEVYARGRSLAVNDRLVLRGIQPAKTRFVGPVRLEGRTSVLLAANPSQPQILVWMTPTDAGLQVEPGGTLPNIATERSFIQGPEPVPLPTADRSGVFAVAGSGQTWQLLGPQVHRLMADSGAPILVLPDDGFLALRNWYSRLGVRLCRGPTRIDVPALYARRLDPVAVTANGQVLCLAPDGLVWLAPHPQDGYAPATTRRLPDGLMPTAYVGRLGEAEIVVAVDAVQQFRLVIVPDVAAAGQPQPN